MICYIDLDGVLVNFWDAVPNHSRFDTDLTASYLSGKDSDWWADLKPMDDCWHILELLENFFDRSNIAILTALPPHSENYDFGVDGEVAKGKMEWIHRHIPYYNRQTFVGGHKFLVASKNHVLIDDTHLNVVNFEKYGGKGILVPREWNDGKEVNAVEFIERKINE